MLNCWNIAYTVNFIILEKPQQIMFSLQKEKKENFIYNFFFSFLNLKSSCWERKEREEEEYHSPEAKKYLFFFWLLDVD